MSISSHTLGPIFQFLWLDAKHCEFGVLGSWRFLFFKTNNSWSSFWNAFKLLGNSLILSYLNFKFLDKTQAAFGLQLIFSTTEENLLSILPHELWTFPFQLVDNRYSWPHVSARSYSPHSIWGVLSSPIISHTCWSYSGSCWGGEGRGWGPLCVCRVLCGRFPPFPERQREPLPPWSPQASSSISSTKGATGLHLASPSAHHSLEVL